MNRVLHSSRGLWKRIAAAAALAALLSAWAPAASRLLADTVTQDASPSLVQAGFITKFPLFVSWPEQVWRPGRGPLVIGVLDDQEILEDLQRLAPYSELDGSRIEVRRLTALDSFVGCHIVFIGAGQADRLDGILVALRGRPVLTVASRTDFARRGVHIGFYMEDQRVGFELNQHACESAGLALDFRLRSVARLVE